MKCRQIFEGLLKIDQGNPDIQSALVDELIRAGMLAVVAASAASDTTTLKAQLAEVVTERKSIIAEISEFAAGRGNPQQEPQYEQLETRMEFLAKKAQQLREKILGEASKPTADEYLRTSSGKNVQITYAGRETMHNISSRLSRVGELEHATFMQQIDSIGLAFKDRAEKSKALLKILSPKLKGVDEIHLRTAAAGLSCADADAKKVAEIFIWYHKKLTGRFTNENVVIASETLTLLELNEGKRVDLEEIIRIKDRIFSTDYGKFDEGFTVERAATVLYSSARNNWEQILELMGQFEKIRRGTSICTLVLLGLECAEGEPPQDVADRFYSFLSVIDECGKGEPDKNDRATAAALLTSSEMDFNTLAQRFRVSNNLLDGLFLTRLDTAAAMIAVISQDVTETIDNIRLASGEMTRAKMSLSGLENFSLGLKVVLHTGALISTKTVATSTAAIRAPKISPEILGLTVMLPLAVGIPFLVFHEELVHKRAVTDYRFHPVHSHYVYG